MANTIGILSVSSRWSQTQNDAINTNNSVTDAGQLSYQYAYPTGNIGASGTINEVFHSLSGMSSGATGNFNLQSLAQPLLGYTVTKTFIDVYSITVKNHSTVSGYNLILNVNSSSGFKAPFGYPTGSIVLGPGSCLHRNEVMSPYVIATGNRFLQIVDGGSGARYEISILGHA